MVSLSQCAGSFWRSRSGSVHIMEVMLVGIMVGGAIIAISTLNTSLEDPEDARTIHQEDSARDVLDSLLGLPAENTSVHYSHFLEELILEDLTGDQQTLPALLRKYESADHRLDLQVGPRHYSVVGPNATAAGAVPSGDSAFWHARLGSMIMEPSMSHHEDGMPIQFELLPVWMDRVAVEPGEPALIDVSLLSGGGDLLNHSSYLHYRLPVDGGGEGLKVTPHDPGGSAEYVFSESAIQNGTNYEWDVRFKLEPLSQEQQGVWLDSGDRFQVITSALWQDPLLQDEDWSVASDPDDTAALVEYNGRPLRDGGEVWLNFTVKRPVADGLPHHEALRLSSDQATGAHVEVVLTPDDATQNLPVMVHPSFTSPFPTTDESPLALTVTNPTDSSHSLDSFEVRFSGMAHQFKHDPDSWSRSVDGADVVYTYTGSSVTIPAHGAKTLSLPLRVEKEEGDNVRRDLPSLLEYLGPGSKEPPSRDEPLPVEEGEDPRRFFVRPHGALGGLTGWLDGSDLEDGLHSVRVAEEGVYPPGRGEFHRVGASSDGFLPALQETRHTMRLSLAQSVVSPGDDVVVKLSTGGLSDFLQDAQWTSNLTGDAPTVTIQAGDLIGHLKGDPDVVEVEEIPAANLKATESWTLSFNNTALLGPVVVSLQVDVETVDYGPVSLNFLGHTVRSSDGDTVVPMFANAHLQFWSESESQH